MEKYIIKNCPLFAQYDCFNLGKCKNGSSCNGIYRDLCQDIPDCLLKQIVERVNTFRSSYADTILELLEIEESEAIE